MVKFIQAGGNMNDDGMLEKVIAGTGTCTVLSNE